MRKYIPRLAVALMALLCGRNIAVAQSYVAPDEHRSLAIYQIMVASFIHGDGGAFQGCLGGLIGSLAFQDFLI